MDPTESEKEVVPGTVADSGPPEATEKTAASLPGRVDPIAVGGAVGGMTVGEVIGGAIGGVIGAVAGPGGAAIGAGLGAFAGTSIGAKLGYDVTHELVHPEDADPNASLEERARAVAGSTARRAGEAVGGGIGAAGAHWSGPSWPARWAARSARSSARPSPVSWARSVLPISMPKPSNGQRTLTRPEAAPEAKTESDHPETTEWLANVARETAGETGLAAAFGAIGGLVAGDPGRTLGKRAGTVVAKHLKWALPFTWKRRNRAETRAVAEETESPPEP